MNRTEWVAYFKAGPWELSEPCDTEEQAKAWIDAERTKRNAFRASGEWAEAEYFMRAAYAAINEATVKITEVQNPACGAIKLT